MLAERGSDTDLCHINAIATGERDAANAVLVMEVFMLAGHWPSGSAPPGGVGAPAFGEARAGQAAAVGRLTGSVCTTRASASRGM